LLLRCHADRHLTRRTTGRHVDFEHLAGLRLPSPQLYIHVALRCTNASGTILILLNHFALKTHATGNIGEGIGKTDDARGLFRGRT
jgi:hypothetical protein